MWSEISGSGWTASAGIWAWPVLSKGEWILVVVGAWCCGVAKAGLAGVGMLTVLLMAEVFPGKSSSGVVLPLLIFADILAAILYRQQILRERIRRLFVPILAGIVTGWVVLGSLPDAAFKPLIGGMVLLMLGLHFFKDRVTGLRVDPGESAALTWTGGVLTGFSTMVANAAGPIATVYLLILGLPKREFIATMAWLFLLVNLVKVPFSLHLGLIHAGSLSLNLLLVPAVVAGLWMGRALVHRLPQKLFQNLVLLFAGLAALRLLLVS